MCLTFDVVFIGLGTRNLFWKEKLDIWSQLLYRSVTRNGVSLEVTAGLRVHDGHVEYLGCYV